MPRGKLWYVLVLREATAVLPQVAGQAILTSGTNRLTRRGMNMRELLAIATSSARGPRSWSRCRTRTPGHRSSLPREINRRDLRAAA